MGWLFDCCPADLDHDPMIRELRLFLFFLIGCIAGGWSVSSFAAVSAALVAANNVKSVATGFVTTAASNFQSVGTGVAFGSNFTTQVAGKSVVLPASMRMAANAPNLAVAAVRRVPLLAIGVGVAAWLAPYGLEWAEGQWKKFAGTQTPSGGYTWVFSDGNGHYAYGTSAESACTAGFAAVDPSRVFSYVQSGTCYGMAPGDYGPSSSGYVYSVAPTPQTCPGNYTLRDSMCWPNFSLSPTEEDWTNIASNPLPGAAANEIAAAGEPLPLQNPQWDNPFTDVPLSDPYTDPVTGKKYKDVARVTPATDGKTARVDVSKQEVNPDGSPVVDTAGQPVAPEEQTDFCSKNPDALACWSKGDPEDVDLDKDNKTITLAPDSGWGASGATCPADLTRTIHGGTVVTLSWQPVCQMADTFRPIVIGMAWLSAIVIFLGISRRAT